MLSPEIAVGTGPNLGMPADQATKACLGRPVRVLIVAPSTRILGGQSLQAKRLIDRFSCEAGLEILLIEYDADLPSALRWIDPIPYVRTVARTSIYVTRLLGAIPSVDVVHAFSASFWAFLINPVPAILASRLFGRSCIVNYRSGEAPIHLSERRWAARPLLRLANTIVVPSAYLAEVFARFNLETLVIPNTVDLERFPFRQRGPIVPRLLSNRALEPLYNVECIVRAFAIVQQSHAEAELVVAGDGPLRTELGALVSELGLRNVTFAGAVSPPEMARLYDCADILVSTPMLDNTPNSLIEAFACGLPVVATSVGGVPFLIRHGETGLLVRSGDARATADAILRLIDDPALAQRLSHNGRRDCEERFGWAPARDAWMNLYQELATRCTTGTRAQRRA
jgi:glycosyltransferase involved in cell wall biosynthesis